MADKRHEERWRRRKARREEQRTARLAQYDDFERIAGAGELAAAFRKARRGVSWKESVQRYEASLLMNISEARRKLLAGEDVGRGFKEFTVRERGKERRIKAVHISERVVQKSLCSNVLAPLLTSPLIYDNGACVKGKGVSFALSRLTAHLRRFYRANGFSNDGWALVVDFKKYFDNIDHETLHAEVSRRVRDARVMALLERFVGAFGPGRSLGLGSEISQVCAVFYPNRLDHFIKERLGVKFYGRYMDDLYLIHADREFLRRCLREIEVMCGRLKIELNARKTRIERLSRGMDFLKGRYFLTATGKIVRRPARGSAVRMRRKLKKFRRLVDAGRMHWTDAWRSYRSWRGNFMRRFDAYFKILNMDRLWNGLFVFNKSTTGG